MEDEGFDVRASRTKFRDAKVEGHIHVFSRRPSILVSRLKLLFSLALLAAIFVAIKYSTGKSSFAISDEDRSNPELEGSAEGFQWSAVSVSPMRRLMVFCIVKYLSDHSANSKFSA